MDDYLPNLRKAIRSGKIAQSKKLLARLSFKSESDKLDVIQILALAPDKIALELLSFLTIKEQKDPDVYDRLIQLIIDRAHLNFNFAFILLENADSHTIKHVTPLLRHILSNETDKALLNKLIKTAGEITIESLTDDIAEFIFYDDSGLKSEAVRALEQIGNHRAYEKLEQASKTEKCDKNILDSLKVLKKRLKSQIITPAEQIVTKDEYKNELKMLSSNDFKKRFKAFIFFSKEGSKGSSVLSKQLKTKDHDLIINTLRLISRTIPLEAVNDLFNIINQKKTDNTIRFAVYSTLEAFPVLDSAALVLQGLSESAMFVRIAAGRTLDKNFSDFIGAGIRKTIESGTKKGELLAETILDARAKNIIKYLMISDTFSYMVSNYFNRATPIEVLEVFIEILEKRKLKSTVRKYQALKKQKMAKKREQFIVISSSESILYTYAKMIYACGFSSLTFQRSQDAFEAIVSQKPSAIICDLFLNSMTGMDLAREVRELYSKDEVPVIISALQKNLDQDQLKKELDQAGVNKMCQFPANTSQIKSWIK